MTFKPEIDTVILMNVSDDLREFYFKSIAPYQNGLWFILKPSTSKIVAGTRYIVFEQTTLNRCPNLYPLIDETIKLHSL